MNYQVSWQREKRCVHATLKFADTPLGDGPVFRLRVVERDGGTWVWTTSTKAGMFNLEGETDLGEAEAQRLCEEAIAPVAEQARAWHQAHADSYRDVLKAGGFLKRPTPTEGTIGYF